MRPQDVEFFDGLNEQIAEAHLPLIEQFQTYLRTLISQSFESLEEKKSIALLIQTTARKLGVMFMCPKCQQPAGFRCARSGNSPTGVFSFYHPGSTHGATVNIPELIVCKQDAENE